MLRESMGAGGNILSTNPSSLTLRDSNLGRAKGIEREREMSRMVVNP